MAERQQPVVPPAATPAKRRVSARMLIAWLAGAAVLAVGALAAVLFVDFGGSESSPAQPPSAVPADPAPPPTTTAAIVSVSEESAQPEQEPEAALQPPEREVSSAAETQPPVEEPVSLSAVDAAVVRISDAGDFVGTVWLHCADYRVRLTWRAEPPWMLDDAGDRIRTAAPLGGEGLLRASVTVPAQEIDSPDEAGLVLEANSISGRGTDSPAEGEANGIVRHWCGESEPYGDHALWSVTVEGHAEIRWEMMFESLNPDGSSERRVAESNSAEHQPDSPNAVEETPSEPGTVEQQSDGPEFADQ